MRTEIEIDRLINSLRLAKRGAFKIGGPLALSHIGEIDNQLDLLLWVKGQEDHGLDRLAHVGFIASMEELFQQEKEKPND